MIKPNANKLNPHGGVALLVCLTWAACLTLGCVKDAAPNVPGVVVGDSMAPALLGRHRVVTCPACEFDFAFPTEPSEEPGLVCPNCGAKVKWEKSKLVDPDMVQIDSEGQIERWSVVAFQKSDDGAAGVKRVIGLPGEVIGFENGNVFRETDSGPEVLRKAFAEQLATRILIHDNGHQASEERWEPVDTLTLGGRKLSFLNQISKLSWRRFLPKRCYNHLAGTNWRPRLEDNYGFNQRVDRQLNPVHEVMVEAEISLATPAELVFVIEAGRNLVSARFEFDGEDLIVQWQATGATDQNGDLTINGDALKSRKLLCQLSNFDQQLSVAIDGNEIKTLPVEWESRTSPAARVFVGTKDSWASSVERSLRLWRDLYYFSRQPKDRLIQRQKSQQAEGFFLIGDNLPVSSDSRNWQKPAVRRDQILGRVIQN